MLLAPIVINQTTRTSTAAIRPEKIAEVIFAAGPHSRRDRSMGRSFRNETHLQIYTRYLQ